VAQRSAYAARKLKLAVRGVIENMSWFTADDATRYEIFGAGGGEQLARELGVTLLAQIPLESAVRSGGDSGEPIVVTTPDSERPKRLSTRGTRRGAGSFAGLSSGTQAGVVRLEGERWS